MCKYISNTKDLVDWDNFIDNIPVKYKISNELYNVAETLEENLKSEFADDYYLPTDPRGSNEKLLNVGYEWNKVSWTDYNIEQDPIAQKIANLLSVEIVRCFVSKVDPYVCVPRHWDEGDVRFRKKYNADKLKRFVCFVKDMLPGQTFIVGDKCFYNEEQGNVYEWNSYTDFHSTFNASNQPHFIFHLLGCTK